jgi:hypothetical protein
MPISVTSISASIFVFLSLHHEVFLSQLKVYPEDGGKNITSASSNVQLFIKAGRITSQRNAFLTFTAIIISDLTFKNGKHLHCNDLKQVATFQGP